MSNNANVYPYYQSVLLRPDLTELDEEILMIVSVYQPITARYIALQLFAKYKFTYTRRNINNRLYKTLSKYVTQDEYFRWSLRYDGTAYRDQEEDPELGQYTEDLDVVNLDSTVKIKYVSERELKIKFTKIISSKSAGPQPDIFYIYYKSPLALALRNKKKGDVCTFHGGRCEILEID